MLVPLTSFTSETIMAATLKCDTITNASNTGTANLTLDASGNATVGNTLVMGSSFKRNRIINGDMRVSQRGTSFASASGYTLDRWTLAQGGTACTVSQVAGISGFQNAAQITGIAGNTSFYFNQNIEAKNCYDLASQTVTISFYASISSGTYSLLIGANYANSSDIFSGVTYINSTSVSLSTTPTRFSWTLSLPANVTNGLQIQFVNQSGLTASNVTITGVQLEVGSVATPYERQIYSDQLAQCQRYFQIYRGATTGTDIARMFTGYTYTSTQTEYPFVFPVQMRSAPTLSNSSVSGIVIVANGTSYAISALLIYQASTTAAMFYTVNSALTVGFGVALGNAAASTTMYIALNAEL